ncbi:MAG: hypothetical protein KF778_14665 [Rhodocyclaceae bacterium]|nr:hypothetical protein [Rhodocyclaceae bacterium]MBX3669640.1 hypothetical protein [Rhodocyclaceae bacterium]
MTARFELPTMGGAPAPAFTNSRACREWLSNVPLTTPMQAQAQLLGQINLLNRYPVAADERLRMLEMLRDPVHFVQAETAKKFSGRPLPLSSSEGAIFGANQNLWDTLRMGYVIVLQSALEGFSNLPAQGHVIAQRALACMREQQMDQCRAPHEPQPGFWSNLHAIYAAAEVLQCNKRQVTDPLQAEHKQTSVAASYSLPLLLNAASPHSLPLKHIAIIQRWLMSWSHKVSVHADAPEDAEPPPIAIDLQSDTPGSINQEGCATLRWMDVSRLSNSIRKRVLLLQRGETPQTLKLGDDCIPAVAIQLLQHLYRHCCRGGFTRSEPRRSTRKAARLVAGLPAAHQLLASAETALAAPMIQDIFTFGRGAASAAAAPQTITGYTMERWRVEDESPAGMRMTRLRQEAGMRIGAGQLVAVCPDEEAGFLLGNARWALTLQTGELQAGVRLFAGSPDPVEVRLTGGESVGRMAQGFLLPAVPRLKQPASVVIPATWYRPQRVLAIRGRETRNIKLLEVIERGVDFERALYEPLAST